MTKKRAFISFDYDNDKSIKELLVGQAKNSDTPFNISDWSIKEHLTGDWKAKAKVRMNKTDVIIVLCGEHNAPGVNAEVKIAQEEGLDYFLLAGYKNKSCRKPNTARGSDKLYNWSWDNLKLLIAGRR